jgi:hypothetical protein
MASSLSACWRSFTRDCSRGPDARQGGRGQSPSRMVERATRTPGDGRAPRAVRGANWPAGADSREPADPREPTHSHDSADAQFRGRRAEYRHAARRRTYRVRRFRHAPDAKSARALRGVRTEHGPLSHATSVRGSSVRGWSRDAPARASPRASPDGTPRHGPGHAVSAHAPPSAHASSSARAPPRGAAVRAHAPLPLPLGATWGRARAARVEQQPSAKAGYTTPLSAAPLRFPGRERRLLSRLLRPAGGRG